MASTSPGMTRKKSITRMITAWDVPVKCPAAIPTTVPITIDTAVAAKPTSSEIRDTPQQHPEHVPSQRVGAERVRERGRFVLPGWSTG